MNIDNDVSLVFPFIFFKFQNLDMKKFDLRNIILMMVFYMTLPRALKAKKC